MAAPPSEDLAKLEPMSRGRTDLRKRKPKQLAIINENCTGCAGSPVCVAYCPVEACMFWIPDEEHPPFGRVEVDKSTCIGCAKCVEGCNRFGNGSLFLQIRHDRCVHCNECAIARTCPGDAFRRVPARQPYLLKTTHAH